MEKITLANGQLISSNFKSLPFYRFQRQQRGLEMLGVGEGIAGPVVAVWGYHPQQSCVAWPSLSLSCFLLGKPR